MIIEIPNDFEAWTIRSENLGEPQKALKLERITMPTLEKNEVLVKNIAAGLNYNAVWASMGKPVDIIKMQKRFNQDLNFLIPGSESSGIVCKVGENVENVKVGDEVICIGTQFDCEDNIQYDARLDPSFRIWGYESNWGAYAEYSKVQDRQCIIKPKNMSWTEAATTVATGATVYSMLTSWKGNEIKEGDVVLIWGGSGGVGSSAIILTKLLGGIPVPVTSNAMKGEKCIKLGAPGYLNRSKYKHFGALTEENYTSFNHQYNWKKELQKMRRDIWKIVGKRQDPNIVIEHPGQDTLPTSMSLCDKNGMVVICGGTSGYIGSHDLRNLWLHMKRLQGSHASRDVEVKEYIKLVTTNNIQIPIDKVIEFDELKNGLQDLYENNFSGGKIAVIIDKHYIDNKKKE